MYRLMKLVPSSKCGHMMYDPVTTSYNLKDISDAIKKHIKDGCPAKNLRVLKDVEFEVLCGVKYKEESEA